MWLQGRLVAIAILAVLAGCATPVPSVSTPPSASTSATPASSKSPTPSPSAAVAPQVVCNRSKAGLARDGPLTLTCENGVAAAEAVVRPDLAIAYIEFRFGYWCPPGYYCALPFWNDGHVIFHVKGQRPDLLVQVSADEDGRVTAESPQPMPTPSS
jgi:hypothetical protein